MLPGDEELLNCNETELLFMARKVGAGVLRRGLPKEVLLSLVVRDIEPTDEHFAKTQHTRAALTAFVQEHIGVVRSQLPGCNGLCSVYPCSEGRHALCYIPNQ